MRMLLTFVLLSAMMISAQNVKFGHVDSEYIFDQLPEGETADKNIEQFELGLRAEVQKKYQELQQKVEDYQNQAQTMVPAQRQSKEKELQELQRDIQNMQMDAEQQMQEKQLEYYEPIYKKIEDAIKSVAKKNNITHVFRSEMLIEAPENEDISDLVLAELGVKAEKE
ncbi:MAG: OmpH family outer membrane protein [Melioribacteraceae bacterium]|nr:OmpH family outer membrane protein [Melioribacteraceae bacterium]